MDAANVPKQSALAVNNVKTRAQRSQGSDEGEIIRPTVNKIDGPELSDEDKNRTVEQWAETFARYENDIVFIRKGFEKGRFEDAVADLNELFAIMLFDTKLHGHAVVVAFFKTYPDLSRLHRDIVVEGYTPRHRHWWTPYDTGKSLFLFPVEHPLRQLCGRIATAAAFDNFIMLCIIVGVICMALESEEMKQDSSASAILNVVDLLTSIIFTVESLIRIIWMSLLMGENAYLNDNWFQLDAAIVIFGWLGMIPEFPNFKSWRGFRMLRALKGIRILSYCAAVLETLFVAMPLFRDVGLVTVFLMLVFGIAGVQLFAGALRPLCQMRVAAGSGITVQPMLPETACGRDLYNDHGGQPGLYATGFTCPRGFECVVGDNPDDGYGGFDNIATSVLTIFQMMTLEGWTGNMYRVQYAATQYCSYYFVFVVLAFGFVVVNLYIAVIVQTFAKIRRRNDRALMMEMVEAGQAVLQEDGTITVNPTFKVGVSIEMQNMAILPAGNEKQVATFLESLQLEQYTSKVLELVDSLDEVWLLSQDDLASIGMKLVHIRRLMDATKAPPAFHDPLALAAAEAADGAAPAGTTPQEEILAFLRAYQLEQYYSKLVKLCDSLDELTKMSQADFEYAGLKLHHARQLAKHLDERRIAMPQQGEEILNPTLIAILGGESVGLWRARRARQFPFFKTWLGQKLLYMWYNQDPMVDMEDPPPPAPRTKFIKPYTFDNAAGHILASVPWEVFISVVIMVNIITMSMEYYGASDSYLTMLGTFEVIFFFIFVLEMALKFKGMGGLKWYFREPFNQFDFVLVTSSIPSIIEFLFNTPPFINLSMLRVMKMLRLLKLLRQTRQLLVVVSKALKPIGNLILFIVFTLSLAAIMGMSLFGGLMCDVDFNPDDNESCPETPRVTFDNFGMAIFALFQCMTGEDWNTIMFNAIRQNPLYGIVFFLTFFILLNYILMEMFCAVILENFQLRAEERHGLQRELLAARKAKTAAANALAESVNRELAKIKEEQEKKDFERDQAEREQRIRRQNEAKRLGLPFEDDENGNMKTEEEIEKEKRLAAQREQELREEMEAQLKAAEPVVSWQAEEYLEDQPGSANKMILDKIDDKPMEKRKKNEKVVVVVEKSCFFFSQDNPFRELCFKIENNPLFDTAMFTTICVSSVVLALETPYHQTPTIRDVILYADSVILAIFTLECCIRVVSSGFTGKPSAYINDPWNRLDFFVLCFSYICVMVEDIPGAFARTIRIGRAIRPLRMINQNERIQIVFNALFFSLGEILNVCFLLLFILFMFAVMGMGFFMGVFWRCNDDSVDGKTQCVGHYNNGDLDVPRVWANPRYSFDSVFQSLVTLYEVSSLEGWTDVFYSSTDYVGDEIQPIAGSHYYMWWFIVVFICVGPFFVVNLVVGVIIEKFNQITGRGLLTDEQRMYKDTLLQAMLYPDDAPLDRPKGCITGRAYAIVTNQNFETFILFLVVTNSIIMAAEYYKQPQDYANMMNTINLAYVCMFAVEMSLKMTGLGLRPYFSDPWNIMDFVIVTASLLMVPLDGLVNIQVIRPLRLFVIFRMIRRARGIRLMITTLLMSLPALFNVTCLLGLAFFVYAVLGMSMFANVRFGENLTMQANFRYFDSSLLLLTRMVTGEAWNALMHDCMVSAPKCTDFAGFATNSYGNLEAEDPDVTFGYLWTGPNTTTAPRYWLPNDCGSDIFAYIYFVSFQIVGNYMVINLFVAVILDNYAFISNVGDAEISEFVLEKFKKTWYSITLKDKHVAQHLGKYMRLAHIREFMTKLGAPLGIVLFDTKGIAKYKKVLQEVRKHQTPGLGISYRKMQYVLCIHAMALDHKCDFPLEEKEARQDEEDEILRVRCALMLQSAFRGKRGRQALGVVDTHLTSEADIEKISFKKKFIEALNNPNAASPGIPSQNNRTTVASPVAAPRSPAKASKPSPSLSKIGSPPQGMASPGIHPEPVAIPTSNLPSVAAVSVAQAEEGVAQVRNVFRERAAQRRAAKEGLQAPR